MSVWKVHSETTAYENPWLTVNLADVELPDGRHLDHYLLRQRPVAACAMVDDSDRVLMLWRHRFIPDAWGWELPSGVVDPGESPIDTAAREAEEETGWRPGQLSHLFDLRPAGGLSDYVHHVYWTTQAEHVGDPEDDFESERIEWVPLEEAGALVEKGLVAEANAVATLLRLYVLRRMSRP